MEYPILKFKDIGLISTGKYDVNHSTPEGAYLFFTCAAEPFRSETYSFDDEVIILPGNGANVGLVLYYSGKIEAYQRTYILSKIKAFPKYVYYVFQAKWPNHVKNKQYGSATNYIRYDNIADFPIVLPPLKDQQRIATILDHADSIRRKNKQILEKYNELAQSVFFEMFGDCKKNPNNFEIRGMDSIAYKITDGEHITPRRSTSGYKLLSARNIKNGYIDLQSGVDYVDTEEFNRIYKRCNPEKGDILISCSGSIGRVTVNRLEEPFVLVRSAALVKPKTNIINPLYFENYLRSSYMQLLMNRTANASSQANLFTGQIKKLPVMLPPVKLQNDFAEIITNIEMQEELTQKSLEKSEDLFQSLLQRAFKGEL